jgi:tRNA C32,U32 (ribose-2'-O)-methylase TrmJ
VLTPRDAAPIVVQAASEGHRTCILFGNEKTGISAEEMGRATHLLRIPMAGDQPSINLAQAVQVVAYELLVTALAARAAERPGP